VGNHAARGARQENEIDWSGLEPRHERLPAGYPAFPAQYPERFMSRLLAHRSASHYRDDQLSTASCCGAEATLTSGIPYRARFPRPRGALVQDKAMFIRPDHADSARKR
jgi:hypothetical protein